MLLFMHKMTKNEDVANLLNPVNIVSHDYVDVYHKYLSLFLLSSSFCPLSHSSLSISFYQPTPSNSSLTFSIPHSILPACPFSFFPDLIIYFWFSHIHLSTPHSPLSFFPHINMSDSVQHNQNASFCCMDLSPFSVALLFALCRLAKLFDVSSLCSHPSIMAIRS